MSSPTRCADSPSRSKRILSSRRRAGSAIYRRSSLPLQAQLATIEDAVQNARRYYNAVVRDFNTPVSTFPSNLFAGPIGYKELEFFQAEEEIGRCRR